MSSFRSHVAATPTRILFALDESDNLQQVSDGTCKQSTSNAKIRRPIDENLSINGLNSSYSSYHHDIGASWLNATASTPSFHSIDLTTPTCGSKAVIMNNSDDKNDDSVVIMESDDSDESTQESEEDRIRREEEESIRLAQQLMMQDSMEVYEMQRNFLAQHSNLMNTDDWNAIQAIMNEPNAVHEPQTDNDMEYEDSGEMNYEQLLELGEILGDVKTERWRSRAKNEIMKIRRVALSRLLEENSSHQHESCCSICRDPFNVSEEVMVLPCQHYFHSGEGCVTQWLMDHNSCPMCKKKVTPSKS